jgi:cytochrome c oxidase subunit 2
MLRGFLPEVASAHGGQLDQVTGLVHWLMLVLFVGWAALFVYILFRFRQKRQPQADYRGLQSHASNWVEGAVAVAEVILLVLFSIPLYSARVDDLPSPEEALEVRVVAEQFAWNIHYSGPDGIFGRTAPELVDPETNPLGLDRGDPAAADDVTTVNQLHLEVDRPALVHLSTKDVIHSFSIPEMRVKQDAIPGMNIPVWFVPTMTSEELAARRDKGFEIACTQLCGIGHYRMRGFVTVHSAEGFAAWMAEQQEMLAAPAEDDFWS